MFSSASSTSFSEKNWIFIRRKHVNCGKFRIFLRLEPIETRMMKEYTTKLINIYAHRLARCTGLGFFSSGELSQSRRRWSPAAAFTSCMTRSISAIPFSLSSCPWWLWRCLIPGGSWLRSGGADGADGGGQYPPAPAAAGGGPYPYPPGPTAAGGGP